MVSSMRCVICTYIIHILTLSETHACKMGHTCMGLTSNVSVCVCV
jgi:hypothetical protein